MTSLPSDPHASHSLKVGLIGCGKMGLQHVRAIASVSGAQVVGIADPQADRELLQETLPSGAIIVADVAELMERVRPDVVHIVTPPHTHAQLARQALRAGCHVYVEKPFTETSAEAESVFALAAERGLKVCAGHQYLFERPALKAAEALPGLGRLVHVESFFSFRMVRRTIAPSDQSKDILPHAVYPLLAQLRQGAGLPTEPFQIAGLRVRPDGDIYALISLGECTGVLIVTLSGRPVEQYQQFVCSNGWLRADYVIGGVVALPGPGAGLGVLFTPYRRAMQTLSRATSGFWRLITNRKTSYPGLVTLIDQFYESIRSQRESPLSPQSILDTVRVCETVGRELDRVEADRQHAAETAVRAAATVLPAADRGVVVVTGGTGMLGTAVVRELRHAGYAVRALSRRVPRWSTRVAGVDYHAVDLGAGLDVDLLADAGLIVHCAAETSGGKSEHERNSIVATRHVIEAAARAKVGSVLHISSLAVLKPGRDVQGPLDEQTPVDVGNIERGPYVWGKAESEVLAQRTGTELGVDVKIVRPGPLVDYHAFHPPGRLGRELGPVFMAIGGKRSALSVCDVNTAGRVIRWYADHFSEAPRLLNLVEAPPPTRKELADRFQRIRTDLRMLWVPAWLLRLGSGPAKLAQRLLLGSQKPVDVYAAFASERYRTDLAQSIIERAGPSVVSPIESAVPQHV